MTYFLIYIIIGFITLSISFALDDDPIGYFDVSLDVGDYLAIILIMLCWPIILALIACNYAGAFIVKAALFVAGFIRSFIDKEE